MHNLLRILGLFGKWPFFVKMNLKWPLLRGNQFKFHFYSWWQGNQGSSQSFHVTSFSKDHELLTQSYEIFDRNKMHGNTDTT